MGNAKVVTKEVVSEIEKGLCVFVGIKSGDTLKEAQKMVDQVFKLRLWEDENGRPWKKNVKDEELEIMFVSNFTLCGKAKGSKLSFNSSMKPDQAREIFHTVVDYACNAYNKEKIKSGQFGEYMKVQIV